MVVGYVKGKPHRGVRIRAVGDLAREGCMLIRVTPIDGVVDGNPAFIAEGWKDPHAEMDPPWATVPVGLDLGEHVPPLAPQEPHRWPNE
jgi:hypothetical protein